MYSQGHAILVTADAVIRKGMEAAAEMLEAAPADLPPEWAHDLGAGDLAGRARRVADFIAGMTDRFALAEHTRLFDSTPELR